MLERIEPGAAVLHDEQIVHAARSDWSDERGETR